MVKLYKSPKIRRKIWAKMSEPTYISNLTVATWHHYKCVHILIKTRKPMPSSANFSNVMKFFMWKSKEKGNDINDPPINAAAAAHHKLGRGGEDRGYRTGGRALSTSDNAILPSHSFTHSLAHSLSRPSLRPSLRPSVHRRPFKMPR